MTEFFPRLSSLPDDAMKADLCEDVADMLVGDAMRAVFYAGVLSGNADMASTFYPKASGRYDARAASQSGRAAGLLFRSNEFRHYARFLRSRLITPPRENGEQQ